MKAQISLHGALYSVDLSQPLDLSIALHPDGPRAWYVDKMRIEPVKTERFNGSVADGGSVNFRNVWFNPHAHGTHTESLGHIDRKVVSVNDALKQFFFFTKVISIRPEVYRGAEQEFRQRGDQIICQKQVAGLLSYGECDALIIRTLHNPKSKTSRDYSHSNPAYFEPEALSYVRENGVKHLLVDLPSVDREEDGGKLAAHHAFWYGGRKDDATCTITEFIYVNDAVSDGFYLLNLQTAALENDATPSRPVLYRLETLEIL